MLDIKFIRENPEKVKEGLSKRNFRDVDLVEQVLKIDRERRKLISEIENLRTKRKKVAKERNIEEGKKLKGQLSRKEPLLKSKENELKETLYSMPNLPLEDVPEGAEENKKVIRKVGETTSFDFKPKDHLELGENLNIIDVERAAKVSGSRFAYLRGDGALLELALVNFAFRKLVKKDFTPIFPPMLVKKDITDGLGYWHGGGNENYYFVKDYERIAEDKKERELDLYLVGTGEHSVVPYHADEFLVKNELPKRYVAFSGCFRREAGSYGRDTRGILRVHQFDKVEMVVFAAPEDDEKIHKEVLANSEELMKDLGLPYQVVVLAARDMGFPTAKTYDIETWLPGQGKYRETHSISTTTDYQARRLNIKYKKGKEIGLIHILNGTALAIGRTIIAILENYQQKDGSVVIPEVLRDYVGKDKIFPKR